MKKIIFLLFILPFMIQAQNVAEDNTALITESQPGGELSKKQAREKLEDIRQKVLTGKMTMFNAASLYTEDPGSIKTGGEYRGIIRGQFVHEFEALAFSLQPGEISEIFETQYGFHFIQVIANHGESVDVRHILVKPK
jgi:peptidyl-prolyl cis-trans isomerase SurA